jgi:hypothetical protein
MWSGFIWLRIGASGGRVLVNAVMNFGVPLKYGNYLD